MDLDEFIQGIGGKIVQVKGKIEQIDVRPSPRGGQRWALCLGKNLWISTFQGEVVKDLKVGDEIEAEVQQKGQWFNIQTIERVIQEKEREAEVSPETPQTPKEAGWNELNFRQKCFSIAIVAAEKIDFHAEQDEALVKYCQALSKIAKAIAFDVEFGEWE